ncbi:golgin subfamily A member 2 isoform X2 [Procambarus clarkii]|uniref:golgin subfamily A member 2 isoform X2 n=1 Tax=Procambarus clarkii TaxID=6728 RepID=UPI00374256F6
MTSLIMRRHHWRRLDQSTLRSSSSNMADSAREQKLAAARKKLRQFQKKKGTKRMVEGGSKDGGSEVEGSLTEESSVQSESGTLSSRASSVDLASEEFTEIREDPTSREDSDALSHKQSLPQNVTNGENGTYSAGVIHQIFLPDASDPGIQITDGEMEAGASSALCTPTNIAHVTQNKLDLSDVSSTSTLPHEIGKLGNNDVCMLESSTSRVEDESSCAVVNDTLTLGDHQTQTINDEESHIVNKLGYSSQLPVAENKIFTHDSFLLTPQSCSDSTSSLPVLSHNEASCNVSEEVVTNVPFIQPTETTEQKFYTRESNPTCQRVTSSDTTLLHLSQEELGTEVFPSDSNSVHEQPDSSDVFEGEGSVSSETSASVTTAIHVSTGESQDRPILKSSSESLRQISLQLSGLMSESEASAPALPNMTISELERRNAELAALLQNESQTSMQQAQYTFQLKAQLERLEAELSAAQAVINSAAGGGAREVESLREQLQVHIQTIGILVSEKSELQSNLTHANHALKQKSGEVIELDGRLSASRQRVGELEASLKDLTSKCTAAKSLQDSLSKELDASKMANFKTNKVSEDLKASVAELTERLSVKTSDYDKLCSQLTDTKSQLAMAQLHVQQLRDGTSEEIQSQLEKVQASHLESQRQLQATQAALSQAHAENSKIALQYQQYTTQLATQTQSLQEQMKQLMMEKEALAVALEETKAELEAVSQPSPSPSFNHAEMAAESERLDQSVTTLQEEKLQLKEQNAALINDNNQLSKLVDQLSHTVEELEMKMERNKTEEVDTSRLLAAMQSDKVAAARALTQNKQLKEQLEELQSGFIIMSNKKLELTEKLEKELHIRKALNQEIATLNEDLTNMKQHLVDKDREIVTLKENGESLGRQLMLSRSQNNASQMTQHTQEMTKEISRYEERVNELEEKLRLSQVEMEEYSKQNSKLHSLIEEYSCQARGKDESLQSVNVNTTQDTSLPNDDDDDGSKKLMAKIATLTSSVSKLEMERNNLQSQLDAEKARCAKLSQESTVREHLSESVITSQPTATSKDSSIESFKSLQEAHKALEERFSRCMLQVAELSDDKQRLEHVIQQLQVETETIGDYITIYQFQRGVMKQQARERELELSSLMHEREEMRTKLATLQDLMASLAQEKGPDQEKLIKMTRVIKSQSTVMHGAENGGVPLINGSSEEEATEHTSINTTKAVNMEVQPLQKESKSSTTDSNASRSTNQCHVEENPSKKTTAKSPTVQRILDLLNEMEATSQVEHCGLQKFHPCPLCSGKLITV